MSNPNSSSPVVRAIRIAIRPFIRLMIASGITYPILTDLLKGLFVDVALKDFRLDGRDPTDSRVSLLTGLQRRDVRRFREGEPGEDMAMPESVSFGAQLVAKWLGDASYVDDAGQPRPLPRYASGANGASFEDLVAGQSKDIRARVVLDEWLRLGIVSLDDQDRVLLDTDAFVPKEGAEEKIYYFAHNLHDHAAVATANLLGDGPTRLERSVYYDELSAAGVEELDAQSRQLGMKLLKSLSRSAMDLEARDANAGTERHRFTCGVYFYTEPVAKDPKQ